MNVLFLSSTFGTFVHNQIIEILSNKNIEGTINFHFNIYEYLRSRRWRDIIKEQYLAQKVPDSMKTYYPGLPKYLFESIYPEILYWQLKYLYRKSKFDLIHAHKILPTGYAAMRLADKLGIPFIVTTHGSDFYKYIPEIAQIRKTKPYSKQERKKVQKVLLKANKIICVSLKFSNDIQKFFPEANVEIIQNSYRSDIFFQSDRNYARNQLRLPHKQKIILSVGNFVTTKGHEYLIKSMLEIKDQFPEARLVLIGGGPLKNKYIQLCNELGISNIVTIIDLVKQDKLPLWYNSSDVFVLSSLDEAFGIALVEAMACGIPAIATNTHGPIEIIQDGIDGFIIPSRDQGNIAKKVNELLSNNSVYDKMSKNAAQNMKKKYSKKNLEIINMYRQVIKNK
ncbi:glycosyltransferase [bacterium]|nr:glycosyltransferase [bacterium]